MPIKYSTLQPVAPPSKPRNPSLKRSQSSIQTLHHPSLRPSQCQLCSTHSSAQALHQLYLRPFLRSSQPAHRAVPGVASDLQSGLYSCIPGPILQSFQALRRSHGHVASWGFQAFILIFFPVAVQALLKYCINNISWLFFRLFL